MGDWVKLELDVRTFDAATFGPVVQRCLEAGTALTTLAALGETDQHYQALYDLNKECSADIPGRGPFYTFSEYMKERVEVPSFDPLGVVVALDRDEWIGMAATSDHRRHGYVFNEMTGVRAGHRGNGIALTMKVRGVDYARACGVPTIRTVHHAANHRAIAMNRRLGYVDADW